MLEIKNVEVHGLERAMAACRNPMSVGEIDTTRQGMHTYHNYNNPYTDAITPPQIDHLKEELKRAKSLGKAVGGSGHDNFLKGIIVQFDVKYPQYWTPEYQRYKFESIISSQSKMHRLMAMASNAAFSEMFNKYVDPEIIQKVQEYCNLYNEAETDKEKYEWFMKALSNLPLGFEMWMTCSSNYLSLKTIVNQLWNHKLNEWRIFCRWAAALPMFRELTGFDKLVTLLEE